MIFNLNAEQSSLCVIAVQSQMLMSHLEHKCICKYITSLNSDSKFLIKDDIMHKLILKIDLPSTLKMGPILLLKDMDQGPVHMNRGIFETKIFLASS